MDGVTYCRGTKKYVDRVNEYTSAFGMERDEALMDAFYAVVREKYVELGINLGF